MLFSVSNIARTQVHTLGERPAQGPEAEQSVTQYDL